MAYAAFQAELLSLLAAATGTHPGGGSQPQTLFTSVEALNLSIVEYVKQGLRGGPIPPPPYVVVLVGALAHDPEWGVASRTYHAPVTVAAILARSTGATQDDAHALVQAAADAIDDGDLPPAGQFATFQSPPERAGIDSSENNVVTQGLAADSRVQIVAATANWTPGLLVSR